MQRPQASSYFFWSTLFYVWKIGKPSSLNTTHLKVLGHSVWVHSSTISSLFGISYSSWDPWAIELCSLNMCYFIPFNFKLSDVSTSVLCSEEEKAEQTQTPRAGIPEGICMLEGALGHIMVHALSHIQPALPDEHSQSCSAVPPGSTASTQLGTHHLKPRGSFRRKTFLHDATKNALHTQGSYGNAPLLQWTSKNPCTKLQLGAAQAGFHA